MSNDPYYTIQAAIIQAAATIAANMPPPGQSELDRAKGEDKKEKLLDAYQERFSMTYSELAKYLLPPQGLSGND